MTEKRVYLGTVGPHIFDDTEDLDSYETGVLAGRKQAALTTDGSVLIADGGDIVLEGSDTNPSILKFTKGIDTDTYMALGASESDVPRSLAVFPDTSGQGHVYFGVREDGVTVQLIRSFVVYTCINGITFRVYDDADRNYYTGIEISPAASRTSYMSISDSGFFINTHKTVDLGASDAAFDDVYADDFQNVADFYHLDTKDDLATLEAIKGSGKVDVHGLELIDDDTLPEWMLTKHKETGDVVRDPEGKPYLSVRMVTSLVMGACRQLNRKLGALESEIAMLKNSTQGSKGE